jgi:hypothetical protein
MQTYLIRLKRRKRKAKHVGILRSSISKLHNEIVHGVLKNEDVTTKAILLKKYCRRLNLILY